jgi:hypothetical protein
MRATKFAIYVPAETMSHVDRAAKRLGMTRSRQATFASGRARPGSLVGRSWMSRSWPPSIATSSVRASER